MIRRAREIENFLSGTDFAGAQLWPLAGDASARRYVRATLGGGRQAMIMDTPAEGENFPAFVQISEALTKDGYSAPAILARDMQQGFLLLEDLGDDSFTKILSKSQNAAEAELYSVAIDLLAQWKKDFRHENLSLPPYDNGLYLREVSLFPDWFLPQIMEAGKAASLRAEYMEIWQEILKNSRLEQNIFVHRDFHADNLMWLPQREGIKRVGLLDFQDATIGDCAYDLVSLLEDARRDVPAVLVSEMIERYLAKTGADAENFYNAYNILGAQRNSKIVGIFVRLAVRDGKKHYLKYLPRVWRHLERDVTHPALGKLRGWLDKNIAQEMRGEITICR